MKTLAQYACILLLVLAVGCRTVRKAPPDDDPTTAQVESAADGVLRVKAQLRGVSLAAVGAPLVLEWDKPSVPVSSYKLYQTAGTLFTPVSTPPGSATNTTVPGLSPDVTYRFYLTALDAAGAESAPSNVVTNRAGVVVPPSTNHLYLEAESGVIAAPMAAANDPLASGGRYVASPTGNAGTVRLSFTVPAGTYVVWCRTLSPAPNRDSLWVSDDGAAEIPYGTARGTWSTNWQWTYVSINDGVTNAVLYPLTAGNHTLQFRGREVGTKLDRVLITTDRLFNPNVQQPPVSTNTPPTLGATPDRTVAWVKTWPGAVFQIVVGDSQTAAGNLTVTATSSNQGIVPQAGLVWTGAGATRTLSVTPAPNAVGFVTITVSVNDGAFTTSDSFVLQIP